MRKLERKLQRSFRIDLERYCWSLGVIMVRLELSYTSTVTHDYSRLAVIVDKDADLKLALQAVLFAAVGTA